MKHKKYDSHMAPNAGSSEARMNSGAHGNGQGIYGSNEIGLKTKDAHITNWGDPGYAMEQYHNGSMNYLSEKDHIASSDVKKVHRDRIPEVLR